MTIHRVTVQIRYPTEGVDLGQVSEGFYTIANDMLTVVRSDGGPIVYPDETPVDLALCRHRLSPNENPESVARMMIKKVRRVVLGKTEEQEAFSRPLRYAAGGVA